MINDQCLWGASSLVHVGRRKFYLTRQLRLSVIVLSLAVGLYIWVYNSSPRSGQIFSASLHGNALPRAQGRISLMRPSRSVLRDFALVSQNRSPAILAERCGRPRDARSELAELPSTRNTLGRARSINLYVCGREVGSRPGARSARTCRRSRRTDLPNRGQTCPAVGRWVSAEGSPPDRWLPG